MGGRFKVVAVVRPGGCIVELAGATAHLLPVLSSKLHDLAGTKCWCGAEFGDGRPFAIHATKKDGSAVADTRIEQVADGELVTRKGGRVNVQVVKVEPEVEGPVVFENPREVPDVS